MIVKSHVRGGYRAAAAYLKDIGGNEQIRLVEISDPHAGTLDQAFENMWSVAANTRATKPLHHASINPHKDERLTDDQVFRICARLEQKFGYRPGEHQRVIVEHIKDGRQHFHVMWNRVNLVTGKPVWPGHHWNKSKQAAREMEAELGLKGPILRRMAHRLHSLRPRLRPGKSPRVSRARPSRLPIPQPIRRLFRLACWPLCLPLRSIRKHADRPAPTFRPFRPAKRRRHFRHEGDTEPALPLANAEMSSEELLAWAWQNGRADILATFGIFLDPDL